MQAAGGGCWSCACASRRRSLRVRAQALPPGLHLWTLDSCLFTGPPFPTGCLLGGREATLFIYLSGCPWCLALCLALKGAPLTLDAWTPWMYVHFNLRSASPGFSDNFSSWLNLSPLPISDLYQFKPRSVSSFHLLLKFLQTKAIC